MHICKCESVLFFRELQYKEWNCAKILIGAIEFKETIPAMGIKTQ